MSAQNLEYEIPFLSAVDKNETPTSALKDVGAYSNSQEDELYTELNACPNENYYDTTPYKKITSEGKRAPKRNIKRLVCVLFVVFIIIVASATFCCLMAIKISEVNSEVTSLQESLSSSLAAMQTFIINTFNRTHVDIWQAMSILTPDALGSLNNPAATCTAVLALDPSSPSGYYWIRFYNGSALHVYCDMTRSCGGVTGGWMRVAELDMTNNSSQCPGNLTEHTDSIIRTCGIASNGTACFPVTFPTGVAYSKVCGRIKAYQNGRAFAFYDIRHLSKIDIDTSYVDGVSLTHGIPRLHIWTFAAAQDIADGNPLYTCHCPDASPLTFVGKDYFCDTASQGRAQSDALYSGNPLWDGAGCDPNNQCCSFNNPPWFHKQLSALTLNDIEMRLCSYQAFSIVFESYDIYIQ